MKIRVNPIACQAHGLCAELLPEWITLDEWGYPIINGETLPLSLLKLNARPRPVQLSPSSLKA
jgi:ferredoxin